GAEFDGSVGSVEGGCFEIGCAVSVAGGPGARRGSGKVSGDGSVARCDGRPGAGAGGRAEGLHLLRGV
ncbi:MAG: hypothetical protein ACK559_06445, partial [bacterium]